MTQPNDRPISERLTDLSLIDAAHARATREALLAHARAGRSVPISDNGHVIWLSPRDILAHYDDSKEHHRSESQADGAEGVIDVKR
jgi:hypothetical protein